VKFETHQISILGRCHVVCIYNFAGSFGPVLCCYQFIQSGAPSATHSCNIVSSCDCI